ncbi:MAG: hypothetical protein KDA75_09380 [Planctomycetaceae bacterium]|nr:hypothetical protein [Planctomycetaceae bacterium]
MWRVLDKELDWFRLQEGMYQSAAAGADGVYRSETFPGLWLDAQSLIQGEMAKVLKVLQTGLASPEHATFLASPTT